MGFRSYYQVVGPEPVADTVIWPNLVTGTSTYVLKFQCRNICKPVVRFAYDVIEGPTVCMAPLHSRPRS